MNYIGGYALLVLNDFNTPTTTGQTIDITDNPELAKQFQAGIDACKPIVVEYFNKTTKVNGVGTLGGYCFQDGTTKRYEAFGTFGAGRNLKFSSDTENNNLKIEYLSSMSE